MRKPLAIGERVNATFVEGDEGEMLLLPRTVVKHLQEIEPAADGVEIEILDDGILVRPRGE